VRALILCCLLLSGCATIPWGASLGEQPAPFGEPTQNGIVVMVGEQSFDIVSGQMTSQLAKQWPEGLELSGSVPLDGAEIGLDSLTMKWQELRVVTQAMKLVPASQGVGITVDFYLAESTVTIEVNDSTMCTMSIALKGELGFIASLGKNKYGAIHATALDDAKFKPVSVSTVTEQCLFALGPKVTESALLILVDEMLNSFMINLAPTVAEGVPDALGLNLATAHAAVVANDSMGVGRAAIHINSPELSIASLWHETNNNLIVPFSVVLEALRHPCVPAYELPRAVGRAIPAALNGQPSLLVNSGLAIRAFHVAWQAGAFCAERATKHLQLTVKNLKERWPALSALPDSTPIRMRIWPKGVPEAMLEEGSQGGVSGLLNSGSLRVELMGEVHGTWLELSAVEIELELRGTLGVVENTYLAFQTEEVRLTAYGTARGLLEKPDRQAVEELVGPVFAEWASTSPLLTLPQIAAVDSALKLTLVDGFLVFAIPQKEASEASRN
jgi:hypothetical protein